jgi:hypothetical protein
MGYPLDDLNYHGAPSSLSSGLAALRRHEPPVPSDVESLVREVVVPKEAPNARRHAAVHELHHADDARPLFPCCHGLYGRGIASLMSMDAFSTRQKDEDRNRRCRSSSLRSRELVKMAITTVSAWSR